MRPLLLTATVALGLGAGLIATPAAAEPAPQAAPAATRTMPAPAAVPARIRMMTFNIEEGGTHVSFRKVVEAIRVARADVVTVDEAFGNTKRLARALGWKYHASRLSIVSRLPIIDPSGADGYYVYVQPAPNTVVAVTNLHLPSWPGNTERILKGAGAAKVLRTERRVRLPAIAPTLARLSRLAAAGIPSFVQGDLNSPSFQDWTPSTLGTFPQIKFPMDWPVSRALADSGFTDSYRAVHPDPKADPGITWPAARPRLKGSWNPPKKAPRDRIDYIWSGGPATAVASQVVGERGPSSDLSVSPWPSDHRALVSTFEVLAAPTPVMASVARRLTDVGKSLAVRVRTDGRTGARLLVVPQGYATGRDLGPRPETALVVRSLAATSTDQRVRLGTKALGPGAYDAVLVDRALAERARITFWVKAKKAGPKVKVRSIRHRGSVVDVRFARAPGNQWDWVGIYARGADDPSSDSYLNWAHTGGRTAGTVRLAAREDGDSTWPLPPGRYTAVLLVDDGFRVIARCHFTVPPRGKPDRA